MTALPLIDPVPDDTPGAREIGFSAWMYSSGRTGRPKGIVHLQHDLQAFVVLNESQAAGTALTRELQDYVQGRLLPYTYPRVVEYLGALPKTGTGKIDRQALKQLHRASA